MDNNANILSMLGLALRGNRLVVGEEPVEAVARARDARVLLLASDAADNTRRRCRHFAEAGQCLFLTIPFTKAELGQVTGRSAVAIAALTDVGMAAAFVHKLAALDPKTYGEAAERLDVKAKRAAERKAEMLAHEKNLRKGKHKPQKEAQPAPVEEQQSSVRSDRKEDRRDERKSSQGPRKSDSGDRKPYSGDRKPHDRDRKPYAGRPGGDNKPRSQGHGKSRPSKGNRPKSHSAYNPYAHSRPVKKGKGSFRKRED